MKEMMSAERNDWVRARAVRTFMWRKSRGESLAMDRDSAVLKENCGLYPYTSGLYVSGSRIDGIDPKYSKGTELKEIEARQKIGHSET